MVIHKFDKSIIIGKQGERMIEEYFENNPSVYSVSNVSDNKYYKSKDIDFVVFLKNKKFATVELKTDTTNTGNIFFETISNLEAQTPGCMYVTKAKYLFYYFIETKELYIMDMDKYRKWFEKNKNFFKKKKAVNENKEKNGTYTSIGYTISKKFLENNFKFYKKLNL